MAKNNKRVVRDKHILYTASVQSVEADLDFFERVFRKKRGRPLRLFKEDFCGTAALASEWVKRRRENEAWGVDLDRKTLEWGRREYVGRLGDAASRVRLICDNVLAVTRPRVDAVAALNFSFSVFKKRDELRSYFTKARQSLLPGGIFFVDNLGGTEAMEPMTERRRIAASNAPDGSRVPAFTYIWEQASFNPVNNDFKCRIHFKLADGTSLRRAFVYDWRLWSLKELQELMLEAGFKSTDVYTEGWDDDEDDTDGIFRRRVRFDNEGAWVAYVVGMC